MFGFRRRSSRLFDLLGARWRYAGSIQFIAAPDLATKSVGPDKFLAFLSGRLPRLFIKSREDLDRRITELDVRPDVDGRFRVDEFFCTGDFWRAAVQRLMEDADLVVMDLRGFASCHQGCIFEIKLCSTLCPCQRSVFLIDGTIKLPFLEEILRERWHMISSDSPNAIAASPMARLLDASDDAAAVRIDQVCVMSQRTKMI